MSHPAIKEYAVARSKIHHGFLLSGLLAIFGLVVWLLPDPTIAYKDLMAALLLIGAAGVFWVNRKAWGQRDSVLRLDSQGVWFEPWKIDPVPWSRIGAITVQSSRMRSHLCLEIMDFDRFAAEEKAARQVGSNRLFKRPHLLLPFSEVEANPTELHAALQEAKQTAAR